ncbi:MAG TPA: hypothetical protein PKY50_08205 [Candidatus Competibacter sp.]|nr:hypothetical protein [Candidatus Competibacter sp.]
MPLKILPGFVRENDEIHEWRHACAILSQDFSAELKDPIDVPVRFRLRKSWITAGGGNKSQGGGAGRPLLVFGIRRSLYEEDC